jgi:hypothetical protein
VTAADRYLDLVVRVLLRTATADEGAPLDALPGSRAAELLAELREEVGEPLTVRTTAPLDPEARDEGRLWRVPGETMLGRARLEHLAACVERVVADGVPGDVVDCGVWRGGSAIMLLAALHVHGDGSRAVWLADTFAGDPDPDPGTFPDDAAAVGSPRRAGVPRKEVEAAFARLGLDTARLRFVEGAFRDTLPVAPVGQVALLHLDAPLYEATFVALESLYPKVVPGGFVVVDDYGSNETCRRAVDEFRADHGVAEPLARVDWTAVAWRRAEG